MPGLKTIDADYNMRSRVAFYLNKDQLRIMYITRDVFEQRDLAPEGLSTSLFVKYVLLDIIPKFLKSVSIEEMEKAEEASVKLAEARKELKAAKKRRNKKGG